MGKCEQCIVREFSALKTLNKDELIKLADCKTSYVVKKGEVIFEEGDHLDGILFIDKAITGSIINQNDVESEDICK